MAATSTNKQPLLIDRVLHYVVDLNFAQVSAIDVGGTNTAELLIDGTSSDGAILEDVYAIARGTVEATINLYLSTASDYLRPNEGLFVGQFKSGTTAGVVTRWDDMPKIIAPLPQTGTEAQLRGFYVPKGRSVWAARLDANPNPIADGPLLGCQGGWY